MSRLNDLRRALPPKIMTWLLVAVAVFSGWTLYNRWVSRPWTRDGQVRATIIKISPQVSGYLVKVPIADNQFVRRGDLLFQIDPASYQLAVDKARQDLDQARNNVASLGASVRVAEAQQEEARIAVTSAEKQIEAAKASVQSALASIEEAKAGVTAAEQLINQRQAELNNAKSEAERAKRLADKQAGSVEDAESTAATAVAKQAELASAEAGLVQAQSTLRRAEAGHSQAEVDLALANYSLSQARAAETSAMAAVDQAKASLGVSGEQNVQIRTAKTSLAEAELDLDRTRLVAPCNGYVSNLAVDVGTYASAGQALVSVVDSDSFRVHAYFQETKLRHMRSGDRAVVTLMGHPDSPLEGTVENVGNAVNPPNVAPTEGVAGEVPQIQPTFDWVRLPQRVPVRIRLADVPGEIQLISGMTASVAIDPSARE